MSESPTKSLPLKVVFRDLNYSVVVGSGKTRQNRIILKDVSGSFKPGRLTCIMGASGAGKTSLLNVLAGEATGGVLGGQIFVNSQEFYGEQMKKVSGFVFQDDLILSTMTVREAIEMSTILRVPNITPKLREEKIQKILEMLNLEKAQNTIIGNERMKGISGGERKRTSVAMELVTDPRILYLDEPTTGLDTFTAYGVMKLLKDIARDTNRTMVATIHQPSSELFGLFDDLLLLADGKVMYEGPAELAPQYCEQFGYFIPPYTNPADFLFMDILNNEEGESTYTDGTGTHTEKNRDRIVRLLGEWPKTKQGIAAAEQIGKLGDGMLSKSDNKAHTSFLVQFPYLFIRGFKGAVRNPLVLGPKIGQTIVISLLIGLLYLNTNQKNANVIFFNEIGVFFFLALNNVMQNSTENLTVFGAEKGVFVREHGAGYYSLASYFISKFLIEIPFQIVFPTIRVTVIYFMVGFAFDINKFFLFVLFNILTACAGLCLGVSIACAFESLQVGLVVSPLILLPLMLFSGFFANAASIPDWLSWIGYISPIKYGFEGMVKNEFTDLVELSQRGFGDSLTVSLCIWVLLGMCGILLVIAYGSLYRLLNSRKKTTRAPAQKAPKA